MNNLELIPVSDEIDIETVAKLANTIWHEYFTPLIGLNQVEYMLEKFQSFSAITSQIENDRYMYNIIKNGDNAIGYFGFQIKESKLFLSKLYIKENMRGNGISRTVIEYLIGICKDKKLSCIWLTCNKGNENTLNAYRHFGFEQTDSVITDIGNGYVMDDYIMTLYM
ncbi:MAG: GNAT family N-acetyltransferase [Suipraeoptans sp.]